MAPKQKRQLPKTKMDEKVDAEQEEGSTHPPPPPASNENAATNTAVDNGSESDSIEEEEEDVEDDIEEEDEEEEEEEEEDEEEEDDDDDDNIDEDKAAREAILALKEARRQKEAASGKKNTTATTSSSEDAAVDIGALPTTRIHDGTTIDEKKKNATAKPTATTTTTKGDVASTSVSSRIVKGSKRHRSPPPTSSTYADNDHKIATTSTSGAAEGTTEGPPTAAKTARALLPEHQHDDHKQQQQQQQRLHKLQSNLFNGCHAFANPLAAVAVLNVLSDGRSTMKSSSPLSGDRAGVVAAVDEGRLPLMPYPGFVQAVPAIARRLLQPNPPQRPSHTPTRSGIDSDHRYASGVALRLQRFVEQCEEAQQEQQPPQTDQRAKRSVVYACHHLASAAGTGAVAGGTISATGHFGAATHPSRFFDARTEALIIGPLTAAAKQHHSNPSTYASATTDGGATSIGSSVAGVGPTQGSASTSFTVTSAQTLADVAPTVACPVAVSAAALFGLPSPPPQNHHQQHQIHQQQQQKRDLVLLQRSKEAHHLFSLASGAHSGAPWPSMGAGTLIAGILSATTATASLASTPGGIAAVVAAPPGGTASFIGSSPLAATSAFEAPDRPFQLQAPNIIAAASAAAAPAPQGSSTVSGANPPTSHNSSSSSTSNSSGPFFCASNYVPSAPAPTIGHTAGTKEDGGSDIKDSTNTTRQDTALQRLCGLPTTTATAGSHSSAGGSGGVANVLGLDRIGGADRLGVVITPSPFIVNPPGVLQTSKKSASASASSSAAAASSSSSVSCNEFSYVFQRLPELASISPFLSGDGGGGDDYLSSSEGALFIMSLLTDPFRFQCLLATLSEAAFVTDPSVPTSQGIGAPLSPLVDILTRCAQIVAAEEPQHAIRPAEQPARHKIQPLPTGNSAHVSSVSCAMRLGYDPVTTAAKDAAMSVSALALMMNGRSSSQRNSSDSTTKNTTTTAAATTADDGLSLAQAQLRRQFLGRGFGIRGRIAGDDDDDNDEDDDNAPVFSAKKGTSNSSHHLMDGWPSSDDDHNADNIAEGDKKGKDVPEKRNAVKKASTVHLSSQSASKNVASTATSTATAAPSSTPIAVRSALARGDFIRQVNWIEYQRVLRIEKANADARDRAIQRRAVLAARRR